MHSQWVDGQASTLQQLPNAGLDEARDGTQNVVVDLWRRVSEAEIQDGEVVDPCPGSDSRDYRRQRFTTVSERPSTPTSRSAKYEQDG
jgi:hypothetical protein